MSLIITRNFKRAKAQDAATTDAQFKVGDKVKYTGSSALIYGKTGSVGKIKFVDTKLFADGYPLYGVEFPETRGGLTDIIGEKHLRLVNSRAADTKDSAAADKAPDGWWEGKTIFAAFGWGKSVKGKVVSHKGGVIKLEDGTQFKESDAYDLYAINSRAADSHAAELRVVHAKGVGKWWVEPNLSRFNDADREQTHKGRKEFPDREAAIKYARGTGKTFIVNDACEDSAAKFRIGQEVIVKTKSAEPYKARIVGLWDMSQNGPYNEQGYLIKNIKGGGVESMPEHALSLVTAKDSAEFHVGQRVRAKDPRWTGYQGHALGNGIYTVKKVDRDGTVKLDGFLDVWISPNALVEANDACGKGEDAKNDFANRIMPLVRKIADAQKVIEGVLGEAEEIGYEAAHGEFPDSTFAKKSANQLEAACYEAVTALRKVKTIAVL